MNEKIIARLREGTGLPVLRKLMGLHALRELMFEAADVIEKQDELIRTLTLSFCYINVQEHQPDPEEPVLCWTKNGRCQVGTIGKVNNDDGPSYYCDYGAGVLMDVVCWMPPVAPPDLSLQTLPVNHGDTGATTKREAIKRLGFDPDDLKKEVNHDRL